MPAFRLSASVIALWAAQSVPACPACRPFVAARVFDAHFVPTLFVLLLPLVSILGLSLALLRGPGPARDAADTRPLEGKP